MTGPADGARPARLVVVTGTATEIGKTWVAARVCELAREAGASVAARKPAQSFDPGDDDAGITDAQVLAAATGAAATEVCPEHRWFPVPMAPPMAADALGRPPFTIDDLVAELAWPAPPPDLALVETAGGVRSPLAVDGDTIDVIRRVAPDHVVLVADAGLGTVNAVLLSLAALTPVIAAERITVLLNRYDDGSDLHRRNAAWLAAHCATAVTHDVGAVANALTSTSVA
jgi:dethiobiotin synthetase